MRQLSEFAVGDADQHRESGEIDRARNRSDCRLNQPAARRFGRTLIGPHTDYGHLSILAQEAVPVLEIRTREERWIEAPALPGHFLVNDADMCRFRTDERLHSARRRVINQTGQRRNSIPFFTATRSDAKLHRLPRLHRPG